MITKETIINYFEGRCGAGEKAMVQAWLHENPAKVKECLGVEEWEDFQPADALSSDISGKLWEVVNKNVNSRPGRYSYFKWMAVAASVILAAGLSWLAIFKKQNTSEVARGSGAVTKSIFNNTAQKMALTLSDGSAVELLPGSTLSYPEHFSAVKRDVVLYGDASFDIARDVARPFTVSSNSILITVLGTRFTVNSFEANNATKIILHEGRVMVRVPDVASRGNKKEYWLGRGDIFLLRKANKRPIAKADPSATPANISIDSSSTRVLHLEKDKEERYSFDNYPLDVVFDQLQMIYNTTILYNRADLGNRSFIGKIDKKDPLYPTLKSIALLNHFHLRKEAEGYLISND